MKITKYGHCCLLIELPEKDGNPGRKILTDPGEWNALPDENGDLRMADEEASGKGLPKIDIVLITHEHQDHLHIESLKKVLAENPEVKIITNASVGEILAKEKINYQKLSHGEATEIMGITLEGHGERHAFIYGNIPDTENTGYFINNQLFYPGDALYDPKLDSIQMLALPVAGPWLALGDAIEYALKLKPKYAFPVHDGSLRFLGSSHFLPEKILGEAGIQFKGMVAGDVWEVGEV